MLDLVKMSFKRNKYKHMYVEIDQCVISTMTMYDKTKFMNHMYYAQKLVGYICLRKDINKAITD